MKSIEQAGLTSYRLVLTLVTLAFLLGFKLLKVGQEPAGLLVATWCLEACTGLWVFALSEALSRWERARRLHLEAAIFAPLFLLHYSLSFFSTYFFRDSVVRKFSLLDIGIDTVAFFVMHILPAKGAILYGGALAGVLLVAGVLRWVGFRLPGRPRVWMALLLAGTAAAWLYARSKPGFPNPLVDLASDLEAIRQHPPVKPHPVPRHPPETLDRAGTPGRLETRFDRILVFAMEEITLRNFEESAAALPPDSFFPRARAQGHFFESYFTNNMDSRTGMLALLTSRFVPYQAYTNLDKARYEKVAQRPSLVHWLREQGYYTATATAQVVEEAVVADLPWDKHVFLTEAQTRQLREEKRYACFQVYRFEDSCEDKFLLPQLFELLDSREKVLWVQPFVWGHIPNYRTTLGKSDVAYYGEFLDELVVHLRGKGMLERTLIVVTSDHGSRDRAGEAELSSYRIPLLFFAPGMEPRTSREVYSHLDFKDLLQAELTGAALPAAPQFAPIIGPTHSSIVGVVTREHDFMLLKDRSWAKYVLAHGNVESDRAPVTPPRGSETPFEFLTLLNDYRRFFQASLP